MSRTRCDRTPAWGDLQAAFAATGRAFDLRSAFASDAGRFERFSLSAPHVFADLSKNLIDDATQGLLLALARQCGVAAAPRRHVCWCCDQQQRAAPGAAHPAAPPGAGT